MKDIDINILSKQIFPNGTDDQINLDLKGQYRYKNDNHYIIYKEITEGLEDIKTILKFNDQKKRLLLKRTAPINTKQIFDPINDCKFIYKTGKYKMDFVLKTKELKIKTEKNKGKIDIKYSLIESKQLFSKNELTLTYSIINRSENDDKKYSQKDRK